MAWSPLEFTPLFRAAYERHGTRRVRAEFTHYYLILGVFMVLVLVALAAPIMSLFRSSYRSAEGFVAITSAGFVTYGLIMTVARNSAFPRRYLVYGVAAIVSALGLVVTSLFLGGPLGGYGVATGDIIGGFLGTAVIVTASAIWGTPPEIDIGRMAKLALVAGTCYGIAVPLASATGLQAPLKLASVIAFLLLIFATGVIPASQRHRLWEVSRAVLLRHVRPSELTARAGELPAIDRQIVQALACERQSLGQVVAATGLAPDTVRRRLVSALRRVADIGEPSNHDLDISEYLLAEGSVTERDAIVRALEHQGVDLADLHRIELVWSALRRSGRPATALTTTGGGPRDKPRSPDLEGWALDEQSLALLDDVVRSGCSSAEVADRLGVAKQLVQRRLVSALRIIAGDADPAEDFPHPGEALMAAFLFDDAARTPAAQLWAAGIDPLELHRLELARATVRRASRSNWRRLRERAGAEHAVEPVPPADLGMTDPSG
jgi:DNA-directed RNA polymerase specialized sigma24 family protein